MASLVSTSSVQLSVVVIALNSEKTIERTLQSIVKQNFAAMEVICVDDGSSDETVQIMENWTKRDSRFSLIRHPQNKGIVSSRYDGLMAASGEFILFIDSDDAYEPGAFQLLYDRMKKTGADVCEFGVRVCFINESALSKAQKDEFLQRYIIEEQSFSTTEELLTACFDEEKIKVNVWNKIYRTELVKRANSSYHQEWLVMEEDWLFTFAALCLTKKYDCFPRKLIRYSVGGGVSTTGMLGSDRTLVQHASALRIYHLMVKRAEELGIPSIDCQKALDAAYFKLMRMVVIAFAYYCEMQRCQLYLDTAIQYCSINDFLITFSSMAQEDRLGDVEQSIRKLQACRMPSEEATEYVSRLSVIQGIKSLNEMDRMFRNTITWRAGSVITFIPRKIRELLIGIGILPPLKNGEEVKVLSTPTFQPIASLEDSHNFIGLSALIKKEGGRISDLQAFRNLEYERGFKLLLITDNRMSRLTKKNIDACRKQGIHLTILSLDEERNPKDIPESGVTMISRCDPEKISLNRFLDLFDGLIIDAEDYWTTIEKVRSHNRNTLILTNQAIAVGIREKYGFRKDYDLEKYLDWLLYGNYVQTKDRISVIVPTWNAGEEFETFLSAIEDQKCVEKPEIIVIDSGSTDRTLEIAKQHEVRLYTISQEEFSHSGVRNMGAELATGKYLLFTVQDALPSSCLTFCRLLQKILVNQVAAVSPAEECRHDADLFAKAMVFYYRSDYFLHSPGEVKTPVEKQKDYSLVRPQTMLDDVMCLTEKKTFMKFRYRFSYAEDCDYGLRLSREGYSIGRTDETKAIHSHNRSAYYFLERCIVDMTTLSEIYSGFPVPAGDAYILAAKAITFYLVVMLFTREMVRITADSLDYLQVKAYALGFRDQAEAAVRKLSSLGEAEFSGFTEDLADQKVLGVVKSMQQAVMNFKPVLQEMEGMTEYLKHIIYLQSLETEMFTGKEIRRICSCMEKLAVTKIGENLGAYQMSWKGSCPELDQVVDSFKMHI